jgi:UDP:flavonoid glycosyltransferase YjiC (YdhE family)
MSTGAGHNVRTYAIAHALGQQPTIEMHVYLSSLQNTFSALFVELGIQVHDTNPVHAVNHARDSHLRTQLDWESFIEEYIEPHFLNSQRIARLTHFFLQNPPDVVVSDYDFSAIVAAALVNVPCVLITERYNFTIVSVDNEALENAGFQVNTVEIDAARTVLNQLFTWLTDSCFAVLTDKPYVPVLDKETRGEQLLQSGKMRFVGPMVRPFPQHVDQAAERARYGIAMDDFLLVASLGGTAMFRENAELQQQLYLESYLQVKNECPNARLILITRRTPQQNLPEGVVCVPYIPNWLGLLSSTDLVLAHPGWITVTELSALGVPAIFVLASAREYHELEALQRLHLLGYETHRGTESAALAQHIIQLRSPEAIQQVRQAYAQIAPHTDGAYRAAITIIAAASSHRRKGAVFHT